jgi:hypothetical protein
MKPISHLVSGFLFLSLIPFAVHASNFSFLGNSAMSFFTKEDWKISKSAQNKALNQIEDGARLAWLNPGTGTHGIFLPMHTFHANGAVCRDLEILHTANQVNEKAIYRFCKLNNQWKIV